MHASVLHNWKLLAIASAIGFIIASPGWSDPVGDMADPHDDFYKFMVDKDRARDVRKREERRDAERELRLDETFKHGVQQQQSKSTLYGDVKSDLLTGGGNDDTSAQFGQHSYVDDSIFSRGKLSGYDFMTAPFSDGHAHSDNTTAVLDPQARKRDGDDDDDDRDKRDAFEMKRLLGINYALGDWEPSKLDLHDNGGFTHQKDNGRPVPYRLNGFPDANRGLPWSTDDN